MSVWLKPSISQEIMNNKEIFEETQSIIADLMAGHLEITNLVENMAEVLTNVEAENREKGMKFFTKILKELPYDYLNETQVKFITRFYIDRLKDNHRVIPAVLEGYLTIIEMKHYDMALTSEFFTMLFREVTCQSQVRQDRYNIYNIILKLLKKDSQCLKTLGPDFLYGFISAMEGERDPRNLLFLFTFLPTFLKHISLGHLVEEMFEVISCYYPIDFHPSPDDPAPVTRQDLANALCPCLCAVPEFGEQCMVLLIEKLDSSLRMAKLDSLALLRESCKIFSAETYGPFLKTLWSSIHREISHKTDEELKMAAHESLSALVSKLATTAGTDQAFENFVKGVLISMQTAVAESSTVAQFVKAAKVLLTTANASKESCIIITKSMIPAIVAYYEFNPSAKLQIASIDFLGDLHDMANHWEVLNEIQAQTIEIPRLCLTAVSNPSKEYQIAGFKSLIRTKNLLQEDLVLPFIEVLIHNIQHSQDENLLSVSVATVHTIARKYPEMVMDLVVRGKCDLDNLTEDKAALEKRLNLLSNLASIDDFTKVIISEMLKMVTTYNENAPKVIEALSESMSDASLYTGQKLTEIESDHGLIDSIMSWILKELHTSSDEALSHGYKLISNTMRSLPIDKQQKILSNYTDIVEKCKKNEVYFNVLKSLYSPLNQSIYNENFEEIMILSVELALKSNEEKIRCQACVLIAHFINKVEYGQKFELLYEILKNHLSNYDSNEETMICQRLIVLYGWLTKALIMRGSDVFAFWLKKIMSALTTVEYCSLGAEAIRLIMEDHTGSSNTMFYTRTTLLFKQRMYENFASLTSNMGPMSEDVKEAYLVSWAYVLQNTSKVILNRDVAKIMPLLIESLEYDNKELLSVMSSVLCYYVQQKQLAVADSLQTLLPRLVKLTQYTKSMDVRIKGLQCLYEIANTYRTVLLLPHKQDVLLDLAPSLDDKKRLVRSAAVKARTRCLFRSASSVANSDFEKSVGPMRKLRRIGKICI
ncbi:unnamed protein product [Chilo suppressalis]|uniref:MMS19 nucleotide excision repair protein n=1 Tax=Chilo suppressalis TaxID=168631 RepID=A0ABN8AV05_CHISP|nr:unnamed protein product [Chilo suppressalis]